MDQEIIRQLAAVPPPGQRWKFKSAKDANVEIVRLENLLGVEHGPAKHNLFEANSRASNLAELLKVKTGAANVKPLQSVAGINTQMTAAERIELAELRKLLPKVTGQTKSMVESKIANLISGEGTKLGELKKLLPKVIGATHKMVADEIARLSKQ